MEKILTLNSSKFNLANTVLNITYLIPLLLIVEMNSSSISSLIFVGVSVLIWKKEQFYLILPLFIFFYSEFILPGGLSLYRFFSLLLFLKMLISRRTSFERIYFLPLGIIALYCALVVSYFDARNGLFIVFDMFLIIMYISVFVRKNLEKFFTYYVFGAVISCLYGWFTQGLNTNASVQINNQWVDVSRFVGSFTDPNYFGFFINIAIFALIILDIFQNKKMKVALLVFLYIGLLATLSITGFLCNMLMLLLFFALSNRLKTKYLMFTLAVGGILFLNLSNLANTNLPIISMVARRIESQLSMSPEKDLHSLTTERSSIWREHLEIYLEQPLTRILFGGNYLTDFGFDPKFDSMSHQAFIDMLLNFGLIGTLGMILFLTIIIIKYLKNYFETKKQEYLFLVIIKGIWIFYAFGLSMFPSWRFNFFFFI